MSRELIIISAIVVLVLAGLGAYVISRQTPCRDFNQEKITVGSTKFSVHVAATQAERIRGLGGCTFVPEASGMLFRYEAPQRVAFWMKGMVIPLDMIWIADGAVIGMVEQVPPPGKTKTELLPQYKPPRPVDAVLEIEAGGAKKYGIVIGSPVTPSQ